MQTSRYKATFQLHRAAVQHIPSPMPSIPRGHLASHAFHILNRGNGGATVFHADGDYRGGYSRDQILETYPELTRQNIAAVGRQYGMSSFRTEGSFVRISKH